MNVSRTLNECEPLQVEPVLTLPNEYHTRVRHRVTPVHALLVEEGCHTPSGMWGRAHRGSTQRMEHAAHNVGIFVMQSNCISSSTGKGCWKMGVTPGLCRDGCSGTRSARHRKGHLALPSPAWERTRVLDVAL
jgi:hypothetical protein